MSSALPKCMITASVRSPYRPHQAHRLDRAGTTRLAMVACGSKINHHRRFEQMRCASGSQQPASPDRTRQKHNIPGGVVTAIVRQSGGTNYSDYELSANGVLLKLSELASQHYRLTASNRELEQLDGFPRFQGVYGDTTRLYILSEEGTGGTACPALYRVIDLSGQQPMLTPQFGSCSDLVAVTLVGAELQVRTPAFQTGPEVVLIKHGKLRSARRSSPSASAAPLSYPCPAIASPPETKRHRSRRLRLEFRRASQALWSQDQSAGRLALTGHWQSRRLRARGFLASRTYMMTIRCITYPDFMVRE